MVKKQWLLSLCLFFPLFVLPAWEPAAPQEGGAPDLGVRERLRREELIRILGERNIPFEERSLFSEYGGFGSSVHVRIPASTAPGDISFVLAIPLSGTGEEFGAPGELVPGEFRFEAALAFIEKIRSEKTEINILVAFLGDEVLGLPAEFQKRSHIGLEDLYDTLDSPEDTVLWYLDVVKIPRRITVHHGTADTIAPLSILASLPELCAGHHIPHRFAVRFNELYKLRLIDGPPALQFAQSRGINALYITGDGDPLSQTIFPSGAFSGEPLPAEEFAAMLAAYTADLQISVENPDYHFTIINFWGRTFFVSEPVTLMVFLLAAGMFFFALLIYSILYRHILIIQWQIFIRRSWMLLIFLAFLMITLQGGGLFLSFLLDRFHISQPSGSYGDALLKLLMAMVLFSFLNPLPELLSIPRKENFYGNAAVILITLGILMAALLDITLIPLFLWAFLFIFLGAAIKIPLLVYLSALFTPIQAVVACINILNTGSNKLAEIILSGNFFTSFYFAVILLPFMLIFKRGFILSRKGKPSRPLAVQLIPRLVLLAGSLGITFFYIGYRAKQPVIEPVRRTITETSADKGILNIRSREISFLERRITEVNLEARGSPVRFDMYLDAVGSGALPVIYSAPMPFEFSPGRNSIEFILGEGPPNPFSTEIVVPLNFTGFLRVEALYTNWDGTVDTLPPPESDDYVLRVVRTIPLSN
ncbi:MAG: hypothetical protein LBP43_04380 [Treponema sp.]|jgi:hypothetical protein|nr:hypothetical protein [Treponema sp.]